MIASLLEGIEVGYCQQVDNMQWVEYDEGPPAVWLPCVLSIAASLPDQAAERAAKIDLAEHRIDTSMQQQSSRPDTPCAGPNTPGVFLRGIPISAATLRISGLVKQFSCNTTYYKQCFY